MEHPTGKIPPVLQELAEAAGGRIEHVSDPLPDGSGFATMSLPLPADHWLTASGSNVPPMPFRTGEPEHAVIAIFPNSGYPERHHRLTRQEFAQHIREVGRYAIRASTMNGRGIDFDPDAMLQNMVVGFLGYWTATGLSSDEWDNPKT